MIRAALVSFILLGFFAPRAFSQSSELTESARSLLDREDLKAYRGWLKYLIFDVEVVAKRPSVDKAQANEKLERLKTWIQRIEEDPNAIRSLRGVQEWAYESPADGSGQPFMINIPQDYDSARPLPASLYMHGYSGNHSEHFGSTANLRGMFELSVLGRSRGGGYTGLSGADVIDVLDYVEAHWNIDADRIHLLGGSMGGNGTFLMGSRFPHRFASARPTCGFGSDKPFGNLLTLPIYATHSDDDFVVPILLSEGPMDRLRELGGEAVYDWTTGYGHASWDYAEGNARSDQWFKKQTRPDSRNVRNINYTALGGEAMRSWWAEIEEWGDAPKPAKFGLKVGDANILYAQLDNIEQLKLRLDESPFDQSMPLMVSVNGGVLLEIDGPLGDSVYIKKESGGWRLSSSTDKPTTRRHTPGGPNLLYNGEPLLIVYGTQGSPAENDAMLEAAKVASRSCNASWLKPNGDLATDGFDHNQNLYGNLTIKEDRSVTADDIENNHMVLIGTERQNSVVASIAERLPVSLSKSEIEFSDGESYPEKGFGIGLVHFNPDAPKNLVFWVASNDSKLYRVESPVPSLMTFQIPGGIVVSAPGYDCVVSAVAEPTLVAARSFDHSWNWNPRDSSGTIISSAIHTNGDLSLELAKAVKAETASDFAFFAATTAETANGKPFVAGVTRLGDFANRFPFEPIGIANVKGSRLFAMQSKLEKLGQSFYPTPTAETMDPDKTYRLALSEANLWIMVSGGEHAPRDYRLTDIQLATAIERNFPTE